MEKINDWYFCDLSQTTSTNDAVLDLLKKVKAPCIVSSAVQTNGRGRLGRIWQSQAGNLYVSFAYQIELKNLGHMVILSAVAVAETLEFFAKFGHFEIKWPNDVLVNGKKISGILFEKAVDDFWVMGIGINVRKAPNIENPLYPVTALSEFDVKTDRITVLKKLVQNFDTLKTLYETQGFDIIRKMWLDKAYNRGKKVVIKQNGKEISGILHDLDDSGCLIIQTPQNMQKIMAGDVFGL